MNLNKFISNRRAANFLILILELKPSIMPTYTYSLNIPSSKEDCSVQLDNIAKAHGIVPKIRPTGFGLNYTFEFKSEKSRNDLSKEISDKLPLINK